MNMQGVKAGYFGHVNPSETVQEGYFGYIPKRASAVPPQGQTGVQGNTGPTGDPGYAFGLPVIPEEPVTRKA